MGIRVSYVARQFRRMFMFARAVVTRRARERDLREELSLHVEREVERNVLSGMSPADARAQAMRDFGNVELLKEHSRDARGTRWLDELRQDTRYAFNDIVKRPFLAALIIATLTIGIGVNASALSVLNLLFQPIAVPDAKSVVGIEISRNPQRFRDQFSYKDLRLLREKVPSLRGITGSSGLIPVILSRRTPQATPRDGFISFVADDYFSLLGGKIVSGRAIDASDNLAPLASPVAVLGGRYWRTEFGSDTGIVGQMISVNGVSMQVIGVADESFAGEGFELRTPEVWVPAMMRDAIWRSTDSTSTAENIAWLDLTARLGTHGTMARAQLELSALNRQIARLHNVADSMISIRTYRPGALGQVSLAERTGAASIGMLAPLLILLIACANLTNVMLTRAAARQHEFGVRMSLGASRARLIRQLLVESAVFAAIGSVCGLLLTRILIAVSARRLFENFGHRDPITAASRIVIDSHVLTVTMLVALGTVFVVGLIPALRTTRVDLNSVLKAESGAAAGTSPSKSRLRNSLVVLQVACSVVLLLVAGSFARSATRTTDSDVGFDASHLIVAKLFAKVGGLDSLQARAYFGAVAQRITLIPAITTVAEVSNVPFEGMMISGLSHEGAGANAHVEHSLYNNVSPDYFRAMGVQLVRGRFFDASECTDDASVLVISESMASAMWPGEDAIGKRVKSEYTGKGATIIGVVRNVSLSHPGEEYLPATYAPLNMTGNVLGESGMLILRTNGNAAAVTDMLRRTIRDIDPSIYTSVFTLSDAIENSEFARAGRSFAAGAAALGTLALLLASVGLYGVAAFAVTQRTREIGIRMALGARQSDVLRDSLVRMSRLSLYGLLFGSIVGVIVLLGLRALLSGLSTFNVLSFVGVLALLLVTSLIATWVPARRASRIDPMVALRRG